jgi:hypothetical protein
MGISPSKQQSYLQYDNDFELVIRATKDLEYLLEMEFGAPSTKQTGLHDKISHAQNYAGLSQDTVKKMRYLVTCKWKVGGGGAGGAPISVDSNPIMIINSMFVLYDDQCETKWYTNTALILFQIVDILQLHMIRSKGS